jgi:hypothetical protein
MRCFDNFNVENPARYLHRIERRRGVGQDGQNRALDLSVAAAHIGSSSSG